MGGADRRLQVKWPDCRRSFAALPSAVQARPTASSQQLEYIVIHSCRASLIGQGAWWWFNRKAPASTNFLTVLVWECCNHLQPSQHLMIDKTPERQFEPVPTKNRVAEIWAWVLGHDRSLTTFATILAIVGGLWAGGAFVLDWITPDAVPTIETSPPTVSVEAVADKPEARVDFNDVPPPNGEYSASFFEPTFGTVGGGSWGFWMPSLAVATFPSMEVQYSFDGSNYRRSDMSARFFVNEDVAGKSLFLKISVGRTEYGPFRYNFDFGSSAVTELVEEAMVAWPFDKGVLAQPENDGGFPVLTAFDIASGSTDSVMIKAAVSMPVDQYLIDFGDGFYQTFPVESDRGLKLMLDRTIDWPVDGRISIKVKSDRGEVLGPSTIDIDAERLARIHWSYDFDEAEGLECDLRNVGADKGKVLCRPGSYHNTITWAGLSEVEIGLDPAALNIRYEVSMTEADLLTIREGWVGDYTVWWEKTDACLAPDATGCEFLTFFPGNTKTVYVRFHYIDGRVSEIQRIRVT